MGHMPHARARTTPEVRREIQNSQESLMTLAQRYGVNIKPLRNGGKGILSMMPTWDKNSFTQKV